MAQRRGFREYLAGLLAPRDRNKMLTALAVAEPVAGAQRPAVQRLQFFLSESRWGPGRVNARRLELLLADPATAPHGGGVLVIDDSGDRKDGAKTAHVGHQWLGRYGKTDNGVVRSPGNSPPVEAPWFAFYGWVSMEDWQDPVTSWARQLDQAAALPNICGSIIAAAWLGRRTDDPGSGRRHLRRCHAVRRLVACGIAVRSAGRRPC